MINWSENILFISSGIKYAWVELSGAIMGKSIVHGSLTHFPTKIDLSSFAWPKKNGELYLISSSVSGEILKFEARFWCALYHMISKWMELAACSTILTETNIVLPIRIWRMRNGLVDTPKMGFPSPNSRTMAMPIVEKWLVTWLSLSSAGQKNRYFSAWSTVFRGCHKSEEVIMRNGHQLWRSEDMKPPA